MWEIEKQIDCDRLWNVWSNYRFEIVYWAMNIQVGTATNWWTRYEKDGHLNVHRSTSYFWVLNNEVTLLNVLRNIHFGPPWIWHECQCYFIEHKEAWNKMSNCCNWILSHTRWSSLSHCFLSSSPRRMGWKQTSVNHIQRRKNVLLWCFGVL